MHEAEGRQQFIILLQLLPSLRVSHTRHDEPALCQLQQPKPIQQIRSSTFSNCVTERYESTHFQGKPKSAVLLGLRKGRNSPIRMARSPVFQRDVFELRYTMHRQSHRHSTKTSRTTNNWNDPGPLGVIYTLPASLETSCYFLKATLRGMNFQDRGRGGGLCRGHSQAILAF